VKPKKKKRLRGATSREAFKEQYNISFFLYLSFSFNIW